MDIFSPVPGGIDKDHRDVFQEISSANRYKLRYVLCLDCCNLNG